MILKPRISRLLCFPVVLGQIWHSFCNSLGELVLPLQSEKSKYEHRKRIRKIRDQTQRDRE
jgi:hypothetical protein